jgi:hypothetical protein
MDLARMYNWIVSELARNQPVGNSMGRLIDECEAVHPHPTWALLRALPYTDVAPLVRWVEHAFREEFPPMRPLKGLWFGLCNPIWNGEAVADVYLSGSERFDSENIGWATSPEWQPLFRYAHSDVMANIYRVGRRAEGASDTQVLGAYAEYPLCLGYGVFAIREVLIRVGPTLVLGESRSVGVGVGFNGGDWISLGEFGPSGFTK